MTKARIYILALTTVIMVVFALAIVQDLTIALNKVNDKMSSVKSQ